LYAGVHPRAPGITTKLGRPALPGEHANKRSWGFCLSKAPTKKRSERLAVTGASARKRRRLVGFMGASRKRRRARL
jgi:hypothetical protein